MKRMFWLSIALFAAAQASAEVAAPTVLDKYIANVRTLRAEFSQTVTDSKGEVVSQADGKFVIVRPGRFRWELTPQIDASRDATPQLMIADGLNLWFYDRDLEQVSVKPAASALTATPASLLSGDGDFREYFKVATASRRDGLDWVKVTPTAPDADFREAQIGFAGAGVELKRMVLKDKLGQTVRLDFTTSVRNQPVGEDEVKFVPPPGADVIGTPAS